MSFPRYERYKESGVEWLGEVPEHWCLIPLKSFSMFSGGGTPSRDQVRYWDGDIPWVSPKDMKTEEITRTEECITAEGLAQSTANLIPPGTVLLVVRSGILQHTIPVAINRVAVAVNQDIKCLQLDGSQCINLFLLRWVQGLNDQLLLAWSKQGATVESIEHRYLANTFVPLPPVHEQITIVELLAEETAKMDALIEEQRRLIELLKEKRQAVISHAVTKGLEPDALMQDSGSVWLGRSPTHWSMQKVSRVFGASKGSRGQLLTKEYCGSHGGSYPVYSGQTIDGGVMANIDEFEFDFAEPGVLFSTTVGAKAMHLRQLVGKFSLSQNCMIIWPKEPNLSLRFYHYHLQPLFSYERELIPDHMQASFRMEDLFGYTVAAPPLHEQEFIATYLDAKAQGFDTLITEIEVQVRLLQERHSALISAAVTGKIDVRNYTSAEACA